jgi:hypothetical protein
MTTWDEPEVEPIPWGPWDWAWVGLLVFGGGMLVGSLLTMWIGR